MFSVVSFPIHNERTVMTHIDDVPGTRNGLGIPSLPDHANLSRLATAKAASCFPYNERPNIKLLMRQCSSLIATVSIETLHERYRNCGYHPSPEAHIEFALRCVPHDHFHILARWLTCSHAAR